MVDYTRHEEGNSHKSNCLIPVMLTWLSAHICTAQILDAQIGAGAVTGIAALIAVSTGFYFKDIAVDDLPAPCNVGG